MEPQWGDPLGKLNVEPERGAPLGNPSVEPQRGVPVGSPSGEVQWGAPVRSPSGEPMGTPMGKQPSAAPQWGDFGALHRSSTLGFLWSLQLAAMAPRGSRQFPLDAQGSTLVPNDSTGFPWRWEWEGCVWGRLGLLRLLIHIHFRSTHFSHRPFFAAPNFPKCRSGPSVVARWPQPALASLMQPTQRPSVYSAQ